MEWQYNKKTTCCFTGHRNIPYGTAALLQEALTDTISGLIAKGVDTFISGGAIGFDLMAAKAVLRAKEKHPNTQLVMAIPCRDQHMKWCINDRNEYESILRAADYVHCLNERYCTGCMHQRNRFMVQQSEICITFFSGDRGGTAHTIALAEERGLDIINLWVKLQNINH